MGILVCGRTRGWCGKQGQGLFRRVSHLQKRKPHSVTYYPNRRLRSPFWLIRDTGYRTVPITAGPEKEHDEDYLETLPHCPAFKGNKKKKRARDGRFLTFLCIDIGNEIGPFDVSLIPIGAYSPRYFMSSIHCSPEDAVRLHEDVRSKHSVSSMSWNQGAWHWPKLNVINRSVSTGEPLLWPMNP